MKNAPEGTGGPRDRNISIELIDDRTPPELVELVAVDSIWSPGCHVPNGT
jgi:hypothetical protein